MLLNIKGYCLQHCGKMQGSRHSTSNSGVLGMMVFESPAAFEVKGLGFRGLEV